MPLFYSNYDFGCFIFQESIKRFKIKVAKFMFLKNYVILLGLVSITEPTKK